MSIKTLMIAAVTVATLAVPGVASAQNYRYGGYDQRYSGYDQRYDQRDDGRHDYRGRDDRHDRQRWEERRRWQELQRRRAWERSHRHYGDDRYDGRGYDGYRGY